MKPSPMTIIGSTLLPYTAVSSLLPVPAKGVLKNRDLTRFSKKVDVIINVVKSNF